MFGLFGKKQQSTDNFIHKLIEPYTQIANQLASIDRLPVKLEEIGYFLGTIATMGILLSEQNEQQKEKFTHEFQIKWIEILYNNLDERVPKNVLIQAFQERFSQYSELFFELVSKMDEDPKDVPNKAQILMIILHKNCTGSPAKQYINLMMNSTKTVATSMAILNLGRIWNK